MFCCGMSSGDVSMPVLTPAGGIVGAPNTEHGFAYTLDGPAAARLASPGEHLLHVQASSSPGGGLASSWRELRMSPAAYVDGKLKNEEE